jgi:carboxypeptidase family protein
MTRLTFRWPMLTTMLLVWMCAVATLAFGQATDTGTVVGVVTDQSGAVVPGALITLTEASTNSSRTATTNNAGQYVMQNVAPGKYDITVNKSGFSTDKIAGQTVDVGTQTTANFKLQVGSAQTTVEVQSTGTDLQTLNSTIGGTVDSEAINSLPSLLHDVGTFTELQPGVSPDGSVAGAVGDQSTFSLDGGNNTNDMDGDMSVYTPSFAGDPTGIAGQNGGVAAGPTGVLPTPADSVEEFKVNTANQTADFNNSAGAQVEIVTKRGTNQIHGSAYEYYLDNNFSANTWDNNLSATPLPSYHYSKYGAGAGGPIAPKVLGGKTYLFALYQGWRYPNAATYERAVPSANMRNGIVTFGGTNYDLKALDPRGIGINPDVQTMWNKYEPAGNDTSCGSLLGSSCDGINEVGFKGNVSLPEDDDFMVARLDHDFGDKWHFMTSYRYYRLTRATTNQVDIGGFFSGDTLGTPATVASRPQQPWYLVAGLTTNITPKITNDFHYSYLRNFWSWSDNNAPPQISGLGGALEPFGESATKALVPFNVDTQDIRTRFWDGEDHFLRDDVTIIKGSHLLQFGGQYQHNFNYHQRTDNGGGINFTPTYQLGDSAGAGLIDLSALTAQGYPSGTTSARVAAAAYGMVTDSQVAYTRSGNSLTLNAPLTPASDKVTIPYYNVYFSDTWHMKPSFTLTYGMGWTLEMPPTEATGKQVEIVDASDEPIKTTDYLAQRKEAAMAGQVFNPELGFALVGNVGAGLKYPYNPFYGSFSPRVGAAWNPHFAADTVLGHVFGSDATVVRGGYGRIYGRLNGVDLVLVPLLGIGLIQPVQCRQALSSGTCGPDNPTTSTAFRIGVDGDAAPLAAASPTLPQPVYPGYNSAAGSASEALDPNFRPNAVDSFDLTIQRQITRKTLIEVGYIGRLIHHEYQPINLNAVPYMMTSGGQAFSSAYASVEKSLGCATSAAQCGVAVPAAKLGTAPNTTPNPAYGSYINTIPTQPFFESSLKASGFCNGTFSNGVGTYSSCTAAAVDKELSNFETQSVWSMWSDMDNGGFNFPRSMMNTPIPGSANGGSGQSTSGIAENASVGHGNYNGGFVSFALLDWHGLTMHENFTYSKALGTGAEVQATSEYTPNDPFNLDAMYGVQPFNRKLVFNTYMVWQDPYFKGQQGLVGRFVGGWSVAPIFTAGNGQPLYCNTNTDGQAFGGADGANYFDNEQCVFTSKYSAGVHSHYNVNGGTDSYGNSVGTATAGSGSAAVNMFKDPVAVFDQVRAPILGIDTKNPGVGPITGTPYWNVDMSLQKNIKVWERTALQFSMIFTNVFNHNILGDPGLALNSSTTWGVQSAQTNIPRKMEFGLRASF